ncbi:MAG: polysaccharide deacetylase family protein, partial [Sedimentibacter sp.]
MKKKYYLILAIIALLLFSACSKSAGETKTIAEESDQTEVTNSENKINIEEPKDEIPDTIEDPVTSIDMSVEPNELGEIMILMYHGIGDEEIPWQRTPENFRNDLEYMYQNKYQMISLNDYAKGEINTKAGYTPIVLTFDDGRQNNYNLIEVNGELVLDPDCAVGILEEFKKKYSDFNVTASFFLGTNIFGQKEYAKEKLNWLVENGYDIGNHTYSHDELKNLNGEEIQAEIGSVNNIIKSYVPDYVVETLALPHGSNPKDEYKESILEGKYEGIDYETIAVLDVGWRPDYSPFDIL